MRTEPVVHDPVVYLDRAYHMMMADPRGSTERATVWASMATAAAMLQPTPEEVVASYEETRDEVLAGEAQRLMEGVIEARRILGLATRDGSPRHPAIHAALKALEDR